MTQGNNVTIQLDHQMPQAKEFDPKYRRAPKRERLLNEREIKLALTNALRDIPRDLLDE